MALSLTTGAFAEEGKPKAEEANEPKAKKEEVKEEKKTAKILFTPDITIEVRDGDFVTRKKATPEQIEKFIKTNKCLAKIKKNLEEGIKKNPIDNKGHFGGQLAADRSIEFYFPLTITAESDKVLESAKIKTANMFIGQPIDYSQFGLGFNQIPLGGALPMSPASNMPGMGMFPGMGPMLKVMPEQTYMAAIAGRPRKLFEQGSTQMYGLGGIESHNFEPKPVNTQKKDLCEHNFGNRIAVLNKLKEKNDKSLFDGMTGKGPFGPFQDFGSNIEGSDNADKSEKPEGLKI